MADEQGATGRAGGGTGTSNGFDVFLSHNSADKPAVIQIAHRLRAAGVVPFLDSWQLVPGEPWQEALEEALDASRSCAVFIGPSGFGTWENEEMRAALTRHASNPEFRVIPVILPGGALPDRGRLPRFLARLTWVDFRSGLDDAAAFDMLVSGVRGLAPSSTGDDEDEEAIVCPFRGLAVFGEEHAEYFHGRDALIQELVEHLRADRFLAVVGSSGSGKSSVVRAGLIPAVRRGSVPGSSSWPIVVIRPGADPLSALGDGLQHALSQGAGTASTLGLGTDERAVHAFVGRALRLGGKNENVLLVVDQFEEVFTLVEDEARRAHFLDNLRAAVTDPRGGLRVVVTLRADFYDRPLQYLGFGDLLRSRVEALIPLSPDEVERAIVGPAKRVDARLEDGLVAAMLADVADEPGALPLLQYALTELTDRAAGGRLTLDAYREIGGVSGALARRAEHLYRSFDDVSRAACRSVLLRLVALGEGSGRDTRRRIRRSALPGDGDAVVDAFAAHRLLSFDRDPDTREPTVEIAHEALLTAWERLRSWIDGARDDLRTRAALSASAAEWESSGRDESFLVRGNRLDHLSDWSERATVELSPADRTYLAASLDRRTSEREAEDARAGRELALQRRSVRRMRALVAVLASAALVAAGLTAIAVDRGAESARHRDEAAILALTGESLSRLRTDPALAVRLALHAFALSDDLGVAVPASTVQALHWAIQQAAVQYPADAGPIVGVGGPLGYRGVFDIPAAELANLALERSDATVPPAVCDRILGSTSCPPLPDRFPADLTAEPIGSAAVGAGTLAGTVVRVGGIQDEGFAAELDAWSASTGIGVVYTDPDIHELGDVRDETADVVVLPQPGLLPQLAADRRVMDLGEYLGDQTLRGDFAPYLVSLASVGPGGTWPSATGSIYAVMPAVSVKSLVWYRPDAFQRAGYTPPSTMQELETLVARIRADGRVPWCLGLESDDADGWPATDWVEELLLERSGTDVYDDWTYHRIGFEHPEVRAAFARFGDLVFTPGNIPSGPRRAVANFFDGPGVEMYSDPPTCWLYHFPSFFSVPRPKGAAALEAFPFPSGSVIGGASMVAALSDRPEVRELMRFLASPAFGTNEWFTSPHGSFSANRSFDPARYDAAWRDEGAAVREALANDTFRFDASDLMPPPIGNGAFWAAMIRYLERADLPLDEILAGLDAAWSAAP